MSNPPILKLLAKNYTYILILVACVCLFGATALNNPLQFDRDAIVLGQWYRLLTSALIHNNFHHLWLNIVGALILFLLFAEYFTNTNQLILFVFSSLFISLGLLMFTQLQIYMGLSGYLHAVFAWGVTHDLFRRRQSGWLLCLLGISKLVYEQYADPQPVAESLIQISVAIDAHLYGAIAGIILGCCAETWRIVQTKQNNPLSD